jgi:hypothetical protein
MNIDYITMETANESVRKPFIFKRTKVIKAIIILGVVFVIVVLFGIYGYKRYFGMDTTEAIYNTTLTVSNLAIGLHEKTQAEKIFTGIYSLIAGLLFVSLVSSTVAYIFTLYLEDYI